MICFGKAYTILYYYYCVHIMIINHHIIIIIMYQWITDQRGIG